MAVIKLYEKCRQCGGDGILSLPDGTLPNPIIVNKNCPFCNATGLIEAGGIDSDLISDMDNKLDDTMSKLNDIWEKLNE